MNGINLDNTIKSLSIQFRKEAIPNDNKQWREV